MGAPTSDMPAEGCRRFPTKITGEQATETETIATYSENCSFDRTMLVAPAWAP
jgi:hypothetical protein